MATILSYALTNLVDVKETLGIASSDSSWDNIIIRKINQATIAIEKYCDRHFKETTYTQEEYPGTNIDQLVLKQRPVTTTQAFSLDIRNSSLNSSNWETLDTQLYFTDLNAGIVNLTFPAMGGWGRWRATYSAGYATIPEDLAEACATLAAYYVLNADGSDIGKVEMREGSRMVRFANASLSFDELIKNLGIDGILNSYANSPILLD
jgi:hypothetical protein